MDKIFSTLNDTHAILVILVSILFLFLDKLDLSREKQTKRYWSHRDFANLLVKIYLQTLQRPVSHPLRQWPWRLLTPLRPDSADGLRTRTCLSLRHQRTRFRATSMNWSPLLYIVPREPVGKIPIYFFRFKKQFFLHWNPRDLFYMPLSQRKPRKADIRYAASSPRCNTWILRGLKARQGFLGNLVNRSTDFGVGWGNHKYFL